MLCTRVVLVVHANGEVRPMTMASELKLVSSILAMRENAGTDFSEFGADNVFEAIDRYLFAGNDWNAAKRERFEQLLVAAEVDRAALRAAWRVLREQVGGYLPATVRPLIKEFRDYHNQNPGSLSWPLQRSGTFKFARSVGGNFNYEIDSLLSLRAYASPPVAVRELLAEDQSVLSVGVTAHASADTSAAWPFNFGGIGVKAGGTRQITTQRYFKHEPGRLIGAALVSDARHIMAPFARDFVNQHFLTAPSLVLMVYSGHGEARLSANVAVAAPLAYGPLVGAELTIDAQYRLTSTFETRIARLADGHVNIKLDSRRTSQQGSGAALGVRLDVSRALLPVHEALRATLREATQLIDTLQSEWIFSNDLHKTIQGRLQDISDHAQWQELVTQLTEPTTGQSLVAHVRSKLSQHLVDPKASWRAAALAIIDAHMEQALEALNANQRVLLNELLPGERPQRVLHAAAQIAVDDMGERFLEAASSAPGQLVKTLITRANREKFQLALQDLDIAARKIDGLRSQTLDHLTRYIACVRTIAVASQVLSENQLAAKISYYRSRSRGSSVLADITLTPHAAKKYADELDDLLAGKPDKLLELYDSGSSGITLNKSLLGRFAQSRKTLGFSIAVLDFKLQRQSILSSEVEIVEDQITGMVTVGTRSAIRKTQALTRDSRSVELLSVAQLASARRTGVGGLSATFNRREDRLEQEELVAFLLGFEDAGIIGPQQKELALLRAYETSGAALDILEEAEVIAGVQWNDDHMGRLFSLDNPINRGQVLDAVVATADTLEVFDEDDIGRLNKILRGKRELSTTFDVISFFATRKGRKLRRKLQGRKRSGKPSGGAIQQSHKRRREREIADRACSWSENSERLYKAIAVMRDIYHSADTPWPAEQYQASQDQLNRLLRNWIQMPGIFASLYAKLPWASDRDDRVKDATLALIAVLARLTESENADSTFSVQLRLPAAGTGKTIRLI